MTDTHAGFSADTLPTLTPQSDFDTFVVLSPNGKSLELSVSGARCGGCLSKIESNVGEMPGVQEARLNLSTGRLTVKWKGELSGSAIGEKVRSLGYGVAAVSNEPDEADRKAEERGLLISMAIAGFAAANIMLLSVSVWGGHNEMSEMTRKSFHAISGLIALPVLVFSGRHFFKSAWSALSHRQVNMDVPISLALVLAFAVSVSQTFTGGEHAYFDAVAMLLFFLLIGRFLDARLRRRAMSAAHALAALKNRTVTRLRDGKTAPVAARDVQVGDQILIASGERAVVDLRILEGTSEIDESLVTGESQPVSVGKGRVVYAGSLNLGGSLTGEAINAAADSLLSDIENMLEAGEQRRSAYRKIADKAVSLYVPLVHLTALLTFLGWWAFGPSISQAILVAVSTLIITCPCALALAAPVSQIVASSRLYAHGAFLKSGDALERLATCDHIVFDKTGTLTMGNPVLRADQITPETLEHAARLARTSRHPLSRAIEAVAGCGEAAEHVREFPGLGLEGQIDDKTYRLGSAEWVGTKKTITHDGPVIWFAEEGAEPVAFTFHDELRDDTTEAVNQLKKAGYTVEILSGDRPKSVERVANELGIDTWTAEASPQDKVARLENLRAEGRKTLMIGDGLNDAGALSLAYAAIAPGGAMDISQASSDLVFGGSIGSLPGILKTSKRARVTMLQNFGLAGIYNLIAVPLAVLGFASPLLAAIMMSASSIVVTLNALRQGAGKWDV
ncbi:MAG: heavy metal translocating P-type ATPase [Ponticaulis sp.]|nr:heavy metal translocating P-type ATPase [Ponticaulis sp.]